MAALADHAQTLPIHQIVPSALNPRRSFNAAADAELLESVRTHGILTPLLVRCIERDEQDTFEVVAGNRRLAAAQEIGLEVVPVTVRTLTDDQARETAIVENLQREDLAPLDEAESYQALLAIPGASPASVAAAVGKSPAYLGRRLKLLTLVPDAQAAQADSGRPRMSWQEENAERERQHRIFERIVPDLRKAVVLATARVKTTPATLAAMLDERHQPEDIKAAVAACGGKLTLDNFARVVAVLDGFRDLYNVHGAEHAIKELKLTFDLKKAMKAAEAAIVAAKSDTKKGASPKPAKKRRAA